MASDTGAGHAIKIVVVGESGVGKSAWLGRHVTGEFVDDYVATPGVTVHRLVFHTTEGEVCAEVWDVAGVVKDTPEVLEMYMTGADAAIIMFDTGSKASYKAVGDWYAACGLASSGAVAVLVGTKVDAPGRVVKPKAIVFHRRVNIQYYEISAKSTYNFEKPFLYIIRRILGDNDIQLVAT